MAGHKELLFPFKLSLLILFIPKLVDFEILLIDFFLFFFLLALLLTLGLVFLNNPAFSSSCKNEIIALVKRSAFVGIRS